MIRTLLGVSLLVILGACAHDPRVDLAQKRFGLMPDGRPVDEFSLTIPGGVRVKLISLGGIVSSITMPDREGKVDDIVLGFASLPSYLAGHPYFGCITGRVANRIAHGRCVVDGKELVLARNNNGHHLHGGERGFDKHLWNGVPYRDPRGAGVIFTRRSPDGEEGYPGNLDCEVRYLLTSEGDLEIHYEAVTDKTTLVNLTHHSYFALQGRGQGDVLDQRLMLRAARYTPGGTELVPNGAIANVAGTPFDFADYRRLGERIEAAGGYDLNYVLDNEGRGVALAAVLIHDRSGRSLEVWTDQPGLQLYTGNFLDGSLRDCGLPFEKHGGVCLEAQCFPDAPHHPHFPSILLRKGDVYRQTTIYKFRNR